MIPPNQADSQADRHQMSNIKGVNFNTGGSRQRYQQDLNSEISEYTLPYLRVTGLWKARGPEVPALFELVCSDQFQSVSGTSYQR